MYTIIHIYLICIYICIYIYIYIYIYILCVWFLTKYTLTIINIIAFCHWHANRLPKHGCANRTNCHKAIMVMTRTAYTYIHKIIHIYTLVLIYCDSSTLRVSWGNILVHVSMMDLAKCLKWKFRAPLKSLYFCYLLNLWFKCGWTWLFVFTPLAMFLRGRVFLWNFVITFGRYVLITFTELIWLYFVNQTCFFFSSCCTRNSGINWIPTHILFFQLLSTNEL